jgi:hypothetical protein
MTPLDDVDRSLGLTDGDLDLTLYPAELPDLDTPEGRAEFVAGLVGYAGEGVARG